MLKHFKECHGMEITESERLFNLFKRREKLYALGSLTRCRELYTDTFETKISTKRQEFACTAAKIQNASRFTLPTNGPC